jgi:hypothetical protein
MKKTKKQAGKQERTGDQEKQTPSFVDEKEGTSFLLG